MSERTPLPELTDEQAALVDWNIEQFGAFLSRVVAEPERANDIPTDSTLAFHVAWLPNGQQVRLTAFRPRESGRWRLAPVHLDQTWQPAWNVAFVSTAHELVRNASWDSADDVFADVEAALRRAATTPRLTG